MSKWVIRRKVWETNSSSSHVITVTKSIPGTDPHIKRDELVCDYTNDHYTYESIYLDKNGVWDLSYSDLEEGFGRWPFKFISTFKDKFIYAMCEYLGDYYGDEYEYNDRIQLFEDIAVKVIPGCTGIDFRRTKDLEIYTTAEGREIEHRCLKYVGYDEDKKEDQYSYLSDDGTYKPAVKSADSYYEVPAIGNIDHQSAGLLKKFIYSKGISLEEFLTNKRYHIVVDGDEYDDYGKWKATSCLYHPEDIEKEYRNGNLRPSDDPEYSAWLKEQNDEASEEASEEASKTE